MDGGHSTKQSRKLQSYELIVVDLLSKNRLLAQEEHFHQGFCPVSRLADHHLKGIPCDACTELVVDKSLSVDGRVSKMTIEYALTSAELRKL